MADIDEELLALAGDASSDEEDAPMNISRDSSASPDGKHSSRATSRKASGRQRRSDSEEEGEA
jgi:RNA polymerase-associated protein RTF1